jgi:hypothetical protein
MPRCPWLPHDVNPDPAEQELMVGEAGVCLTCNLQYRVVRTDPSYELARDGDRGAGGPIAKPGDHK